jgi:hypothetical protein
MSSASAEGVASFEKVLSAEGSQVDRRRKTQGRLLHSDDGTVDQPNNLVGLALSGGGIRAAAFSLGAICALSSAKEKSINGSLQSEISLFQKLDYISSVSGGSYAACSIAAKILHDEIEAPLSDPGDPNAPKYLFSIRKNSQLLTSYLEIFLNWLYGVASGIVTILPLLLLIAAIQALLFRDDANLQSLISSYEQYFVFIVWAGALAYLTFAMALSISPGVLVYLTEAWRIIAVVGIALVFVALQPLVIKENLPGGAVHSFFESHVILREIENLSFQEIAIPLGLFLGTAALLLCLFLERERFLRKANAATRLTAYQVGIQICLFALLIIGPLFLWSIVLMFSRWGIACSRCGVTTGLHHSPQIVFAVSSEINNWLMPVYRLLHLEGDYKEGSRILPALSYSVQYVAVAAILFILTKYVLDSNRSSFHRYYRDCISRCFFKHIPELAAATTKTRYARSPHITELKTFPGPYLLVNCTLNANKNVAGLTLRADEPFVVGSCYAGNEFSGFVETKLVEEAIGPDFDLATLAAISGAAFSPVMGKYTVASFRLLMSVLSLRLGYWIPNPGRLEMKKGKSKKALLGRFIAPGRRVDGIYLLREMFGVLDPQSPFVYITDGGHTENSGVFELLRRRCSTIIAIDSEADSERLFNNIVYVMELARSRLDIEIKLSCQTVGVEGGTHCAIAEVKYPQSVGRPAASGRIVYCKLSLTGDENLDLLSRKRATGEFPFHSTLNQNYDELLFNAYRILGTHVVWGVLSGRDRVEFPDGEVRSLTRNELQSFFS